jgi:hypothetical protein
MRRDKPLPGAPPVQRQQIAAIGTGLDHQPSSRNANGSPERARGVAAALKRSAGGMVDARPHFRGDAAVSGPRHGFGQPIVGLVADVQRLEFEEFGLGFLLLGFGLVDLAHKLCD